MVIAEEGNTFTYSEEIRNILWKTGVHHRFHKIPHLSLS